ncbi:MAG: UDP-N-acetylglucosamine 2-epimerase (non-hydrolyzing) [archaeon]
MVNKDFKEYKLAFVIGTRAELIKTFPVMLELQKKKIPYYFIHTGQHSLGDFCEKFGVKKPDAVLTEEPKTSSKFDTKKVKAALWNLVIIFKIRHELQKLPNLRYVLYHGDTMTTLSAAIGSSKLMNVRKKYSNVHLEGGLRSESLFEPFPEEISRKFADYFSDIILAVSPRAVNNVKGYKNKKIILTGNSVIDSIYFSLEIAKQRKVKVISDNKFALITIHRHENINNKKRLEKIIEIFNSLTIKSYFMIHDNTKKQFEKFGLLKELQKNKNIILTEPKDYIYFVYQMSKCSLIVCDGGSMQEESLVFHKPCVILRKATERQEGLASNFQFLSKLDVEKTKLKIKEYLSKDFKIRKFANPYGNKGVSKKVVEILR